MGMAAFFVRVFGFVFGLGWARRWERFCFVMGFMDACFFSLLIRCSALLVLRLIALRLLFNYVRVDLCGEKDCFTSAS